MSIDRIRAAIALIYEWTDQQAGIGVQLARFAVSRIGLLQFLPPVDGHLGAEQVTVGICVDTACFLGPIVSLGIFPLVEEVRRPQSRDPVARAGCQFILRLRLSLREEFIGLSNIRREAYRRPQPINLRGDLWVLWA